jgi:pimeloyl-ACP methyl ester carboxylesterase
MFLPCIDGAWDKSRWGQIFVQQHSVIVSRETSWTGRVSSFGHSEDEASGKGDSMLSRVYMRDWAVNARAIAEQGGNNSFTWCLSVRSFWDDFNTRPTDSFNAIKVPLLWVMATNDMVCGPLEFTMEWYNKLQCPKELCILEGEHLAQYFDPGSPKSVKVVLGFLKKYRA